MAVLAGIDEAGFGPILGPLVVTATVFHLPDRLADEPLWKTLAPAVTQKPAKRHAGLAIGDSKKLYSHAAGLGGLERGVLGMLAAAGHAPACLRAALEQLCPAVLTEMDDYPWYAGGDLPLPADCDATDLRLRANAVRSAMAVKGVSLAGVRSEVVLEGRYNRLVLATDNKATTLLDHTARLIDWVRLAHPGQPVRICCDRQGGREHYLPMLQRMYEGARFRILAEEGGHSAYQVHFDPAGRDCLEVHFQEGGEDHHLPVALASMVSKYLRELFMSLLNAYWARHVPGLRPTAGYYTDGHRFLLDIASARQRLNTPADLLIRSR